MMGLKSIRSLSRKHEIINETGYGIVWSEMAVQRETSAGINPALHSRLLVERHAFSAITHVVQGFSPADAEYIRQIARK